MTYKGNETFGTAMGGCCTCTARWAIITYWFIVLFGFFTEVEFQTNTETRYLPLNDPKSYEIDASEFIPAFQSVYDWTSRNNRVVNSAEYYDVTFTLYEEIDEEEVQVTKPAITCDIFIDTYLTHLREE